MGSEKEERRPAMNLETDEILVELIQDATQKALSKLFQGHKEKFYM